MRICHVGKGVCPRTVKLAHVQKSMGFETSLITLSRPQWQKSFPFTKKTLAEEQRFGGYMNAILEENKEADLFHVHTHLTDTGLLEDVRKWAKKPIVWDCHDEPTVPIQEDKENRLVSTEMSPGTVYRTYCPREWLPTPKTVEYQAVIATGLSNVEGHYRNWLPVFKKFGEFGIKVRCYTQSEITDEYFREADMRDPIDTRDLIEAMSSARFGICGSATDCKAIDEAQPNKFYEYIAAGIPVICIGENTKMAQVIKDHGIGYVIKDIQNNDEVYEAIKFMDNSEELREKVLSIRGRFTMESQEPIVREFYKKTLKENGKL